MKRAWALGVATVLVVFPVMTTAAVLDEVVFTPVASNVSGVVAVRHAGDGSDRLFLV